MKNREVIERLVSYHSGFPENYIGCDGFKSGDPEAECSGIAVALVPAVEVIRRAEELGCNLLIVHEPTNYTSIDEPGWNLDFENTVMERKLELMGRTGMTVFRDHDLMHMHNPDSIFTGVIRHLGWDKYYLKDDKTAAMGFVFELPETTVDALADELIEKLSLNGVRIIGSRDNTVRRVAITGHLIPGFGDMDGKDENGVWHEYGTEMIRAMEAGIDCIIPGETVDWTVLSYVRDAAALGIKKTVINIGHFNMEEPGMRNACDYITEIINGELPVHYIPGDDLFTFHERSCRK